MAKRLTDKKVQNSPPGRYYDGNGLLLRVRNSGSRDFALRITVNGKTSDYGLGGYPITTLSEARDKAYSLRKNIKGGLTIEPKINLESQLIINLANDYLKSHAPAWKGTKSENQWRSSLINYVYPKIGKRLAKDIKTSDVLSILKPIWETKNETANRVRGRIEKILDYATAQGFRSGDNPARWKGHLSTILPKPSLMSSVKHFPAMDYRHIPEFWVKLKSMEGTGAAALKWTILTIARSGETRGATKSELSDSLWIISAERMKAGKEHRVPLVQEAIDLIPSSLIENDNLLFKSPRGGKLSDMSISAVLRRMGYGDITVHGFRSTFRDWAGETTSHPREVIEHALAHQLKNKAEAAYARTDLLEKRRKLMADWASFVTGKNQ
ncbi:MULTISPECIES: tyrosine-type recombinase/integrase [Methylotenera]|uniref:tyrosine-type recombinase/integrase n=1 Tax=Methylotenera TaxID=359407 RepID=UPI00035C5963|nr:MULTISPECIES: site-specific integrase [Methylotenera]